ncbi:MAG: MFS transporter [Actinomycetota bacterium]
MVTTPEQERAAAGSPEPLFTREFLLLILVGATNSLGTGALNALLPPFVVDELGGTEATAGVVMGSMAVTALLSRSVLGRVSDRRGARRLIAGGAALTGCGLLLLVVWPSVAGAISSRLVMGAGNAAFFIGTSVRAMELAPDTRRSQAAAYNLIAFHVGMGLGPTLGEWVLDAADYDTAWFFVFAMTATASALSWGLSYRPGDPDAAPSPLIHRNAVWPGVVTLFGVFAFNGYLMFAALYADEIGLDNVGPVFMVSSGTMIVARVLFGRVPDIVGPIRAGSGALVLSVFAAGLLALWDEPAGLFVGAALVALGLSLQSPSFMVIAVEGVSVRQRGSAMATYTAFFDIANALIGPVIGVIVATSGYRAAFLTAAAASGVALVILRTVVAPNWRRQRAAP